MSVQFSYVALYAPLRCRICILLYFTSQCVTSFFYELLCDIKYYMECHKIRKVIHMSVLCCHSATESTGFLALTALTPHNKNLMASK